MRLLRWPERDVACLDLSSWGPVERRALRLVRSPLFVKMAATMRPGLKVGVTPGCGGEAGAGLQRARHSHA
ncbi:hypothetical protein NDU88_006971 [Pleurodeles waltl]|uniref:Uncharacterized protein n=1 Tax=Pleurodeles waltl TaxID=8319 RepID=A0AAV7VND7_PLEWA|nr:hypothetical protein NDU88_006971 [Pleurodeles waltl]